MLVAAGGLGGIWLGEMAIADRQNAGWGEPAPYARLSNNPDALIPTAQSSLPCPDCADSYGTAARLGAARADRMDNMFRELGAVDTDMSPTEASAGEYRYGGRFPDPVRQDDEATDSAGVAIPEETAAIVDRPNAFDPPPP